MQRLVLILSALLLSQLAVAQPQNLSFESDKIVLTMTVCDTIPAKMIFDTGGRSRCILPVDIVRRYEPQIPTDFPFSGKTLGGKYNYNIVPSPLLQVDGQRVEMEYIMIPEDIRKISMMGFGLFCPNYRSDRRIWCLDIDKGICAITERDTIPKGAYILPLVVNEEKNGLGVRLPLDFVSGEDTLRTHYTYLLDTGLPVGLRILTPLPEMVDFFRDKSQKLIANNQDDASEQRLHFTVDQLHFYDQKFKLIVGEIVLDNSQQKLLDDFAISDAVGIIGWQFLKHFNIILDLKNYRLILTPCKVEIKLRASQPSRWGLTLNLDHKKVGGVLTGGAACRAGIESGDNIVSIQNRQADQITLEYIDTLRMLPPRTPIIIQAIRNGETLKFTLIPEE